MISRTRLTVISSSIAVSIVTVSCTTHHRRPPTNAELRASDKVVLANGQSVDIDGASFASGDDIVTREAVYLPSNNIAKVVNVKRGMGMLQGLGIGALAGAGTGAILGYLDGDDNTDCSESPGPCLSFKAREKAVFAGVIWGVLGGITGTIVGGLRGQKDVYQYATPRLGVDIAPTDGGGQFSLVGHF